MPLTARVLTVLGTLSPSDEPLAVRDLHIEMVRALTGQTPLYIRWQGREHGSKEIMDMLVLSLVTVGLTPLALDVVVQVHNENRVVGRIVHGLMDHGLPIPHRWNANTCVYREPHNIVVSVEKGWEIRVTDRKSGRVLFEVV